MKDIELKSFRRNEGHKNVYAGSRDKGLSCYNHLFCGMSLAIICFILLFTGICVVSASVTYDAGTNTIFLEDGTNTLASIYSEINNPSVLDYDSETNTYTLSAKISGKDGIDADLMLEDATLVFNNPVTEKCIIKTWSDITIENMTIENANPSTHWVIWAYAKNTEYSINITNSDFSGGRIIGHPCGYQSPTTPTVIMNNYFHDATIVETTQFHDSALGLFYKSAIDAYIYNNTFRNITIPGTSSGGGPGPGILYLHSYAGCVVDKLYIYNCSVHQYGQLSFYGAANDDLTCNVTNFEIKDCVGDGLSGKEYGNVRFSNGTIENMSVVGNWGKGIMLYHTEIYGNTKYWIHDVNIDGADRGISAHGQDDITADIYNVRINDVYMAYWVNTLSVYYITNSKATNYTNLYGHYSDGGEIREYQLTDIYVVDTNGYPVENATVTITAENSDVTDPSINRKLEPLAQTLTLSKGHTPLPVENEEKTVVLLRLRGTSIGPFPYTRIEKSDYSYNITAEKDGYNATVTVTPDESWYREDPNTYPGAGKGTVIITLPLTTAPSLNITNINATAITSNSTTITWATDKEADTKVTYTTNPSTLGTHWQNDSLQTLTHSILLSELEINTPYYFMVYSTDAAGSTANSTVSNFSTSTALPDNATTVILQSPNDVTDNRLKEASQDTVLGSTSFIDIGRINTEGNYRDVIWFNLTQLNTTAVIKTAKLSLFWYYTERNISTTVEIYRPVAWADNYVTWNTRTNGVAWDNLGGDWYDRNFVAQGTTPYVAVTFPVGAADNVYHEFDVTELVQSYVDGTYENTGFFIKANEVSNSYIAFRSSDWANASERPKLVVSYGGGDAQQNTLSGAVTSPDSTGIADANVTLAAKDGTEIETVQADLTGHYEFTAVLPGDYNITATKHGYWPDSNPVTVNASEPATANIVLCQKGDFNTNSESADAGDLAMMADATAAGTSDVTYDLDGDGNPANENDLTLLKNVSVGVAVLE